MMQRVNAIIYYTVVLGYSAMSGHEAQLKIIIVA